MSGKRWIEEMSKWADEPRGENKSQGSQDKFLKRIFAEIGEGGKRFVEIGFNEPTYSTEGSGSNTMCLFERGWTGLLLDGEFENPEINLHKHYLFSNNICQVLSKYEVPEEPDYLSIDIDSHDLWILSSILEGGFRPRVITTEYNSNYPLELAITMIDPVALFSDVSQYRFKFCGCIFGASALALKIVADRFGYTLVGRVGRLDLVWLRNDQISERWIIPDFEWFFQGNARIGQLHHFEVKNLNDLDVLIDYEEYVRSNDLEKSREMAKKKIIASEIPCIGNLRK